MGFDVPLPDFTDRSFATLEADADWIAVTHEGGPARAFSRLMPAFGEALTVAEIELALSHVRTFCPDDAWPRGELNLPRPLVTTKAFPEDEVVFTTTVATEGPGSVINALLYETRIGARNAFEISLPFGWNEPLDGMAGDDGDWRFGVGDLTVGFERVLFDSLERGAILSASAELSLPTGDEDEGFGVGTTLFEPSLLYGQILPYGFFLHAPAGLDIPFDGDKANEEAIFRSAIGRGFQQGRWGRVFSPMVEVRGARELVSGAQTDLGPAAADAGDPEHASARASQRRRALFGPFEVDAGRQTVMSSASGFEPWQGRPIQGSALCATCHTLYTHTLGPQSEVIGELPEQVPYQDNRLLPHGFVKPTAPHDIAVQGEAAGDPDFTGGGDSVLYRMHVSGAEGPFQVEAALWYQPIAYRWAHNLARYDAFETQRFVRFYESMAEDSAVVLAWARAASG